jgi:hypothetical protein
VTVPLASRPFTRPVPGSGPKRNVTTGPLRFAGPKWMCAAVTPVISKTLSS